MKNEPEFYLNEEVFAAHSNGVYHGRVTAILEMSLNFLYQIGGLWFPEEDVSDSRHSAVVRQHTVAKNELEFRKKVARA